MIKNNFKPKQYVHLGDTLCAGCGQRLRKHPIWRKMRKDKITDLLPSDMRTWKMINELQSKEIEAGRMVEGDRFITYLQMPNDGILPNE